MILRDLKIRCINLDRSTERWDHVSSVFPELIRVPAIDGMQWASGEHDDDGRPTWGAVPSNVQTEPTSGFLMFPTTYGCSLSHLKAMMHFLFSNEPWTIIIEDDTEPVGDLSRIEIPDDCDFYYLIGTSHPGCRLSLWPDGQVRMPRTLGAYVLSRRAAALALLAMDPKHYFQTDWQIPFRCFESMRDCKLAVSSWPDLPYRIKAYGQNESIIQHSEHASISTFTPAGAKPWIPESMLC